MTAQDMIHHLDREARLALIGGEDDKAMRLAFLADDMEKELAHIVTPPPTTGAGAFVRKKDNHTGSPPPTWKAENSHTFIQP